MVREAEGQPDEALVEYRRAIALPTRKPPTPRKEIPPAAGRAGDEAAKPLGARQLGSNSVRARWLRRRYKELCAFARRRRAGTAARRAELHRQFPAQPTIHLLQNELPGQAPAAALRPRTIRGRSLPSPIVPWMVGRVKRPGWFGYYRFVQGLADYRLERFRARRLPRCAEDVRVQSAQDRRRGFVLAMAAQYKRKSG